MNRALAALLLVAALSPSDAVVDHYLSEANDFWSGVQRHHLDTMRDKAHPTHLAMTTATIAPELKRGLVYGEEVVPREAALFNAMRRKKTPLFRAYAALRKGGRLSALRTRHELLFVPPKWANSEPEKFYAKYPDAEGLLSLSAPVVIGDEAFVYARLMMVYSVSGELFYLRRQHGRWKIVWKLQLSSYPGC